MLIAVAAKRGPVQLSAESGQDCTSCLKEPLAMLWSLCGQIPLVVIIRLKNPSAQCWESWFETFGGQGANMSKVVAQPLEDDCKGDA